MVLGHHKGIYKLTIKGYISYILFKFEDLIPTSLGSEALWSIFGYMEFLLIWTILAGTNAFHLSGIGCIWPWPSLGLVGFDLSVPPFAQHCEIPICQNRIVEQPESKSTQPNSQTTCPTLPLLGRAVKCRPPCQMNAASGLELWHVTTHCVPRKKEACHSLHWG